MSRRIAPGASTALSLALVPLLLLSAPAQAAECLPREGTFLPGTWTGYGYESLRTPLENQYMDADEEGAFAFTVDEGGAVDGSLMISGGGSMASSEVIGASTAAWQLDGTILGSASLLRVQGSYTWAIDGVLDLGAAGGLTGFDGGSETEIEGTFAAIEADCTFAYGTFAGLGVAEGIAWVAHRDAPGVDGNALIRRFNTVISHVQSVREHPQPDLDELALAVREMIALNDLLGQSTACGEQPADIALGSPAAAFARDTLGAVLEDFLEQAKTGAYTATEIVRATTLGLASGMFDAPTCGASEQATAVRSRILSLLHDVLAERIAAVSATPETAEYRTVIAAIHQFGMLDLLAGGAS